MKQGWEVKKLGKVFSLEYGKPLPKSDRCNDGLFPVYGANGIISRTNKFHYNKPSIIVGRKGTAGAINLTEPTFFPLDVTYYVTFDENEYNLMYLYYLLLHLDLPLLAKGVKPGINRNDIYSINSSFPTCNEQERIVKILDNTFAKIEALRANAKQNLQNTKDLFQATIKQELMSKDGCKVYSLVDICVNIVDCPHSTPLKSQTPTQYPCIRTSELKQGKIDWKKMQYVDYNEYSNRIKRLTPQCSDIIYGREGSYGDAVMLPDTHSFCLGQRTMLFRPNHDIVSSEFLLYSVISPYVYNQAKAKNSGCGVGHINVSDVKQFQIVIPDLITQHNIITKLDALSNRCKKMEENNKQTIAQCDALKQALLKQAFNGEL